MVLVSGKRSSGYSGCCSCHLLRRGKVWMSDTNKVSAEASEAGSIALEA